MDIGPTDAAEAVHYVDDHRNHFALRHLARGLALEQALVDGEPGWVAFLTEDAVVEASLKPGMELPVVSVDAVLLPIDRRQWGDEDVAAWIDRQPTPWLGVLEMGRFDREDGGIDVLPTIVADVHVDSVLAEMLRELIHPYAVAWAHGDVAVVPEPTFAAGSDGAPYRTRVVEAEPRSAWLLMGDEASFPSSDEIAEARRRAGGGVYDTEWTAPKNGEPGDLVVIYFTAPRKAACFVARLVSAPFWQSDVLVNAERDVDPHQWWAAITPLVEIEPIPYQDLRAAAGGHLPLKGRSGRYLPPELVAGLRFVAADPRDQDEVSRIARIPTGSPNLAGEAHDLDDWKAIPAGALRLEADVSTHLVRPLTELVFGPRGEWTHGDRNPRMEPTLGPVLVREYPAGRGYVDFMMMYPASTPALAVEVKLTLQRPISGVWLDSPDFRQLLGYLAVLGTPGLLIDSHRVLLVRPGADAPHKEFLRSDATWDDIASIRDELLGPLVAAAPRRASRRRASRRG